MPLELELDDALELELEDVELAEPLVAPPGPEVPVPVSPVFTVLPQAAARRTVEDTTPTMARRSKLMVLTPGARKRRAPY
jgi:hypothetical protein